MTENDLQQKILEQFKKETGWNSLSVKNFLSNNNIEQVDESSISKAIKVCKEALKEIHIPKDEPRRNYRHLISKKNSLNTELFRLNQLLAITENLTPKELKTNKKLNQNEGALIDAILKVVSGNDLKKYSLRKFESSLNKIEIKIDHSTLGGKFKNKTFQYFLIAAIMNKTNKVKQEDVKDKLESFKQWLDSNYLRTKSTYKTVKAAEGKDIQNEFIDNITTE